MSLSILVNVIIIKNECMREFSSIRLIFNQNFDVISNLSVYFCAFVIMFISFEHININLVIHEN